MVDVTVGRGSSDRHEESGWAVRTAAVKLSETSSVFAPRIVPPRREETHRCIQKSTSRWRARASCADPCRTRKKGADDDAIDEDNDEGKSP